ncbi:hypothetical protein M3J09_005570 [Ascochyta lentis]
MACQMRTSIPEDRALHCVNRRTWSRTPPCESEREAFLASRLRCVTANCSYLHEPCSIRNDRHGSLKKHTPTPANVGFGIFYGTSTGTTWARHAIDLQNIKSQFPSCNPALAFFLNCFSTPASSSLGFHASSHFSTLTSPVTRRTRTRMTTRYSHDSLHVIRWNCV